jgi:Subtilase family
VARHLDAAGKAPGVDDDGNGLVDDVNGFDFYNHNGLVSDDFTEHGTLVASVLGARGSNGLGVTGIAQRVRILPLQAASPGGDVTTSAAVEAIAYARAAGARVVNMSFGSFGLPDAGDQAIRAAVEASPGILFDTSAATATGHQPGQRQQRQAALALQPDRRPRQRRRHGQHDESRPAVCRLLVRGDHGGLDHLTEYALAPEVRDESRVEDVLDDVVEDALECFVDKLSPHGVGRSLAEDFLEQKGRLAFDVGLRSGELGEQPAHFFRGHVERLMPREVEALNHHVFDFGAFEALVCCSGGREVQRLVFVLVGQHIEEPQPMLLWRPIPALVRLHLDDKFAGVVRDSVEEPAATGLSRSPVFGGLEETALGRIHRERHALRFLRSAFEDCELPGQMIEGGLELVEDFAREDGPVVQEGDFSNSGPRVADSVPPFSFGLSDESVVTFFSPAVNRVLERLEVRFGPVELEDASVQGSHARASLSYD